jgi:hypothetical protein
MRFYGFGNYYLSSLQQGLQSAHLVGELFTQYEVGSKEFAMVHDWGKNHKTMVLLNGGNQASLQELFELFGQLKAQGMHLPFAKFHEDEQSLGGALTYVGVVVPERYYEAAATLRTLSQEEAKIMFEFNNFKDWEITFVNQLNMYRLAS